jgi:hypothetical protein
VITSENFFQLSNKLLSTLLNPSNQLTTSDHCYRCPSITLCPAAQIARSNAIDVSEIAYDSNVDNNNLIAILDQTERAMIILKQNLDAYNDLATHRLKSGEVLKGLSLQPVLGNSEWKEGLNPEILMALTGLDLSKKQLISPTQAKKLGVDINALCERRSKGVKVVRVDSTKSAEKLFGKKG